MIRTGTLYTEFQRNLGKGGRGGELQGYRYVKGVGRGPVDGCAGLQKSAITASVIAFALQIMGMFVSGWMLC